MLLSCSVKNLDGHKVAWIHYDRSAILTVDKTVITRNARIGVSHEGHRTWNLHIRDVQRSDAGAYMCQINTAKAKTRMGHLTVVGEYFKRILKLEYWERNLRIVLCFLGREGKNSAKRRRLRAFLRGRGINAIFIEGLSKPSLF